MVRSRNASAMVEDVVDYTASQAALIFVEYNRLPGCDRALLFLEDDRVTAIFITRYLAILI